MVWDCSSSLLLLRALPLSVVLFLGQLKASEITSISSMPGSYFFTCVIWDHPVVFLFDQMGSQFPLMWSSWQPTWWLGTRGVTMLASTSAVPTSPRPGSSSSPLLSCVFQVGSEEIVSWHLQYERFLQAASLRLCCQLHLRSHSNWNCDGTVTEKKRFN